MPSDSCLLHTRFPPPTGFATKEPRDCIHLARTNVNVYDGQIPPGAALDFPDYLVRAFRCTDSYLVRR